MEEPTTDTVTTSSMPPEPASTWWKSGGRVRTPWRLLVFTMALLTGFIFWFILEMFLPIPLPVHHQWQIVFFLAVMSATAVAGILVDGLPMRSLGFPRGRILLDVLLGTGAGIGLVLAPWGILIALGAIDVRPAPVAWGPLLPTLIASAAFFVLVAATEEILMRGHPWLALSDAFRAWPATIITALVFAALHVGNPGVTPWGLVNITLAGVWLGQARMRSGALWLPIGLHFGWNLCLGTIIGLPVSGMTEPSMLISTAVGAPWLTGGAFGLEGGVAATVALGFGLLLVHVLARHAPHTVS